MNIPSNVHIFGQNQRWNKGRINLTNDFSFMFQTYHQYTLVYGNLFGVPAPLPDSILKESLSELINVYYPPLAGWIEVDETSVSIVWGNDDRNEPSFTSTTIDTTYHQLLRMVAENDSDFVPQSPNGALIENCGQMPIILVKVTRAANSTVSALGISFNHTVMNAKSADVFVNNWAYVCKQIISGTTCSRTAILSFPLFGSLEMGCESGSAFGCYNHKEFVRIPEEVDGCLRIDERSANIVEYRLIVTPAHLSSLITDANSIGVPYPFYVYALLWRELNVLRLLHNPEIGTETAFLMISVDIHKKLLLPTNMCTGASFYVYIDKYTVSDLLSIETRDAAVIVKEALEMVTSDYIVSAFQRAQMLAAKDQEPTCNSYILDRVTTPFSISTGPKVSISHNFDLDMYSADFGVGKPVYIRPSVAPLDGSVGVCFNPRIGTMNSVMELYINITNDIDITRSPVLSCFVNMNEALSFAPIAPP